MAAEDLFGVAHAPAPDAFIRFILRELYGRCFLLIAVSKAFWHHLLVFHRLQHEVVNVLRRSVFDKLVIEVFAEFLAAWRSACIRKRKPRIFSLKVVLSAAAYPKFLLDFPDQYLRGQIPVIPVISCAALCTVLAVVDRIFKAHGAKIAVAVSGLAAKQERALYIFTHRFAHSPENLVFVLTFRQILFPAFCDHAMLNAVAARLLAALLDDIRALGRCQLLCGPDMFLSGIIVPVDLMPAKTR